MSYHADAQTGTKTGPICAGQGLRGSSDPLEWAKKRGLSPGKATRVILADWSDAINGRSNPFAAAIAAAAGQPVPLPSASPAQVQELSAEERLDVLALLQAAGQFI